MGVIFVISMYVNISEGANVEKIGTPLLEISKMPLVQVLLFRQYVKALH